MNDFGSKLTIVLSLVGVVVALAVGTGGLNIWMLQTMWSLQGAVLESQYALQQQAEDLEEIKKQISILSASFGEAPAQIQAAAHDLSTALAGFKGASVPIMEDIKEIRAIVESLESELQAEPGKLRPEQ